MSKISWFLNKSFLDSVDPWGVVSETNSFISSIEITFGDFDWISLAESSLSYNFSISTILSLNSSISPRPFLEETTTLIFCFSD